MQRLVLIGLSILTFQRLVHEAAVSCDLRLVAMRIYGID